MSFVDALSVSAVLSVGSTSVTIQAGDIKRFELWMHPWGIEGTLDAWVVCDSDPSDDKLFTPFTGLDPVSVTLTLGRSWDDVDYTSSTVTLKGLVIEKSVMERSVPSLTGAPVLQRKYSVRFQDRGQALWRQHRPANLYVDKTYQNLIDDNLPDGVSVTHTWSASSGSHQVLALALGADRGDATFYDFLMWLTHKENAALFYAAGSDAYSILDTKPAGTTSFDLVREQVSLVEAIFPPVRRDTVRVLNAWSEAATATKSVTNSDSVTGVRSDYLLRSAISADLDTRATLETGRAKQRQPEVRVTFSLFPTTPVLPSDKIGFGEEFASTIFQHGNTYRATSVHILAVAELQEAGTNNEEPINQYTIDYTAELELAADPVLRHAPHHAPVWPFYVEGKVLSETGADTDGTYQSYTDQTTSLDQYKVKIPLWADQKVVVLYEPLAHSGHFYFPLYRDERVLVALDFDVAKIAAFLDWRPGARLPLDTQGNQILMGK
jgi:hypothetical protein